MAVYCAQFVDGVLSGDEYVIAPPVEGWDDATILAAKAKGAADKGWVVEWTSETSFTATKVRWEEDATCKRLFRIG